jgi:hypothetical protein
MKKVFFIIAIGFFILAGCTGVKTVSSGLENESFLEFIGNPEVYYGGVDVDIDDKTTFKAKVNLGNVKRPNGNVYAISPGTHVVTVSYKDSVIFSKQIFVSAQETRKILLP